MGWWDQGLGQQVLWEAFPLFLRKDMQRAREMGEREPSEGFRSRKPLEHQFDSVFRAVYFLCSLTASRRTGSPLEPSPGPWRPRRASRSLQRHRDAPYRGWGPLSSGSIWLSDWSPLPYLDPQSPQFASVLFGYNHALPSRFPRPSEPGGWDPGAGEVPSRTLGGATPTHKREIACASLRSLNFPTETLT